MRSIVGSDSNWSKLEVKRQTANEFKQLLEEEMISRSELYTVKSFIFPTSKETEWCFITASRYCTLFDYDRISSVENIEFRCLFIRLMSPVGLCIIDRFLRVYYRLNQGRC